MCSYKIINEYLIFFIVLKIIDHERAVAIAEKKPTTWASYVKSPSLFIWIITIIKKWKQ